MGEETRRGGLGAAKVQSEEEEEYKRVAAVKDLLDIQIGEEVKGGEMSR